VRLNGKVQKPGCSSVDLAAGCTVYCWIGVAIDLKRGGVAFLFFDNQGVWHGGVMQAYDDPRLKKGGKG
jgi:hypothetical protein